MKKFFAILLTVIMLLSLVACGGGKEGGSEIKGETYETSMISALVPEGWMAFPKVDIFGDYPNEPGDPTGIRIYKGAKEEFDMFVKPGVSIDYYVSNMTSPEFFYDDVKKLEPIKIGDYTWEGFTGTSMDIPVTVLLTTDPHQIQVTITTEVEGEKISLDDADLQAIIASIRVK